MIDLVLQGAREEAGGGEFKRLAIERLRAHSHFVRTHDRENLRDDGDIVTLIKKAAT